MPLSEDDFNRLPAELQTEMQERERRERVAAIEYEHRVKSRSWSGAMIAGIGAIVLSVMFSFLVPINAAYYPLVGVSSAVAAWVTVHLRYAFMGGLLVIGCTAIAANIVGFCWGLCPPLLFIWPMYAGLGAFVGLWAMGKRQFEDTGF
jgi:hypothetical protein